MIRPCSAGDRVGLIRSLRLGICAAALAAAAFLPTAVLAGEVPGAHMFAFAGSDSVFQVGEELTYNVSYSHIDIGQVKIKLLEKTSSGGRTSYKGMAYIDSYKGLPFVDLHTIYENVFDSSVYSVWFRSRLKEDEAWRTFVYQFDYGRHIMSIEERMWGADKAVARDSLRVDTVQQDGLSLFFLARTLVMEKQHVTVPVIVNEKKGNTTIDFPVEHTTEEIDAVNYPVDVVHFTGEAGFVGILGLTGGFEGWFSNDAARVPIVAKMKVILGSVRIELMSWKRDGWSPPRAQGRK